MLSESLDSTKVLENIGIPNNFDVKTIPYAIILIIIFFLIYKAVGKVFAKHSKYFPFEENITKLLEKLIKIAIIFIAIITIGGQLGVNTTSLIAIFSIFGLAISLSVQNIISNAANGINIYATHPFKINDRIKVDSPGETDDIEGIVKDINLMYTMILNNKNEVIFVPNNKIGQATIINFSHERYRKIEYTIGVSYDNNIEDVKKALTELLEEEPLVIKDNGITVFGADYDQSSSNYTCRAHAEHTNYYDCLWSIKSHIKPKFDQYGITIPYPQLDVTLINK